MCINLDGVCSLGNKIFISYRREDSADVTGRIYDNLIQPVGKFLPENIFQDVASIPFGIDFREHIEATMQNCDVALIIIGPKWLSASDNSGNLRLHDPRDFVLLEVTFALQRGIPVIPLLVMGAKMPNPEDLPDSIRDLAYRNGIEIRRDPDFKGDIGRLNQSLEQWIEASGTQSGTGRAKSKGHILISYHQENEAASEIARTLNTRLKADHYSTWINYEQPKGWKTGYWSDSIEQIIYDSAVMIAVYSEEQAKSRPFKHELKVAKNIRVPVILVLPPYQEAPEAIDKQAIAVVNARSSNNWYENLLKLFDRLDRAPARTDTG